MKEMWQDPFLSYFIWTDQYLPENYDMYFQNHLNDLNKLRTERGKTAWWQNTGAVEEMGKGNPLNIYWLESKFHHLNESWTGLQYTFSYHIYCSKYLSETIHGQLKEITCSWNIPLLPPLWESKKKCGREPWPVPLHWNLKYHIRFVYLQKRTKGQGCLVAITVAGGDRKTRPNKAERLACLTTSQARSIITSLCVMHYCRNSQTCFCWPSTCSRCSKLLPNWSQHKKVTPNNKVNYK